MNPAEKLFWERYVSNPGRNLTQFSFVFMVLGIVLSVGILTAALNLFEGYERTLKSVLLDSFPHLQVQSTRAEFIQKQEASQALSFLRSQPETASASEVLQFNLMAYNGGKSHGCQLKAYQFSAGVNPDWHKYIVGGQALPRRGQAVVGLYLARELGLGLGDTLRVIYPRLDRITALGLYPSTYNLVIGGLYRSGYYEYDRSLVIATLPDAYAVIGKSDIYSGIEVKLKGSYPEGTNQLALRYDKDLGASLSVSPVANITLLRLVKMQKWMIFIIFFFLVLISGINVISAVGTQIFDKKNQIAILKALGAKKETIRNVLSIQIVLAGLLSIILGQLFGLLLSWLAVRQNFYQLKGDVYFLDQLVLYVSPLNQVIIFVLASLLVLLCIKLPLRQVDRLPVIELLRNP